MKRDMDMIYDIVRCIEHSGGDRLCAFDILRSIDHRGKGRDYFLYQLELAQRAGYLWEQHVSEERKKKHLYTEEWCHKEYTISWQGHDWLDKHSGSQDQ